MKVDEADALGRQAGTTSWVHELGRRATPPNRGPKSGLEKSGLEKSGGGGAGGGGGGGGGSGDDHDHCDYLVFRGSVTTPGKKVDKTERVL